LGSFKQIKILRAVRILRLFKRVESLNKILVALLRSIPGVMNALLVLTIFMFIYSIIAVDLYRDFGSEGSYQTMIAYGPAGADAQWGAGLIYQAIPPSTLSRFELNQTIHFLTPRGFAYGMEYFGTFSRSLYTLFQVLTGESWCEAVVRPLIFGYDPRNAFISGLFFTSFVLINGVVLQNVVVTVLLDKFLDDPDAKAERAAAEEQRNRLEILLDALKSVDAPPEGAIAGSPETAAAEALAEARRQSVITHTHSGELDAWLASEQYRTVRRDLDLLKDETAWTKDAIAKILATLPPLPSQRPDVAEPSGASPNSKGVRLPLSSAGPPATSSMPSIPRSV